MHTRPVPCPCGSVARQGVGVASELRQAARVAAAAGQRLSVLRLLLAQAAGAWRVLQLPAARARPAVAAACCCCRCRCSSPAACFRLAAQQRAGAPEVAQRVPQPDHHARHAGAHQRCDRRLVAMAVARLQVQVCRCPPGRLARLAHRQHLCWRGALRALHARRQQPAVGGHQQAGGIGVRRCHACGRRVQRQQQLCAQREPWRQHGGQLLATLAGALVGGCWRGQAGCAAACACCTSGVCCCCCTHATATLAGLLTLLQGCQPTQAPPQPRSHAPTRLCDSCDASTSRLRSVPACAAEREQQDGRQVAATAGGPKAAAAGAAAAPAGLLQRPCRRPWAPSFHVAPGLPALAPHRTCQRAGVPLAAGPGHLRAGAART